MRLFRLYITIPGILLFAACTKKAEEEVVNKTFFFDIKNHDLVFGLKRVHQFTDSVYFQFSTTEQFDCNQYRINSGIQDNGSTLTMLLGNIYLAGSQCIYGSYPATAAYKSPALPDGLYKFIVRHNGANYEGRFRVAQSVYTFNWAHDDYLKIEPKVFSR